MESVAPLLVTIGLPVAAVPIRALMVRFLPFRSSVPPRAAVPVPMSVRSPLLNPKGRALSVEIWSVLMKVEAASPMMVLPL